MDKSETLLSIRDMHTYYEDSYVLQGIGLEVPQSKIIAILGRNGMGKTTLIRLIAGLLTPTDGHITVAGFDSIQETEQIRTMLGYMPQRFGLYEDLTVMQNLNLYADLRGVVGEEKQSAFERLLHFTNLSPFKQRLARYLSGGMKQKLGLACALIKKPKL